MFVGKKNALALLLTTLVLSACSSSEETAVEHLEKGKELIEKGEYDKAVIELKSSNQEGDQRSETYYYMAKLDEKNNNFDSMRKNLVKTIELDGNNLEARKKLGKLHLLFGDLDKAMEQADVLLTSNPNDLETQLLKASVYVRQSKKDLATGIIDSVLATDPENIDALSLKAAMFFEKNDIDNTLIFVDKALLKDNKNLPLRLFKIKVNAKRNDIKSVIKEYKEIINLYPDAENFKLSLASIYSMTDELDQAEAILRQMASKMEDKVEPKIVLLEFLNAKKKDKVPVEFELMLESAKAQPKMALELSKWMLGAGYLDVASQGLNVVVEFDKNSNTGLAAQTILAEIKLNNKDYSTVEQVVNNILQVNSDFVDASLLKARLMLAQNKVDDAIELLNKIVWAKDKSDNAYFLLGQAYMQKKDLKEADKNFKLALDINPANLGAFVPVYNSYLQANQKETARKYLENALKVKPNQVLLLTNKADLDIAEKKFDQAQDVVQRIALFSKNKAIPMYLQANILQGKERYADAVNLYEKLLQEFPDHLNSLVNLARSYEGLKSRDKAIKFLESHHAKNKDNLTIVGVLGDLYIADKNYSKAKELLANQIKLVPDKSAPLYLALAKIEAILHKSADGAKDVYLKGLEANPGEPQLSTALASYYEQTGKLNEARKLYESVIEKYPDANLATNNLAALLVESNNNEDIAKGLALAEKLKDSESPYLLDTYAWGLVKTGKNSEGLKILESLVVKEPKMPELHYHIGMAHLSGGNKATAIIELKQAILLSEKQQHGFVGKEDAKKVLSQLESFSAK